jgi:hypothetical protein
MPGVFVLGPPLVFSLPMCTFRYREVSRFFYGMDYIVTVCSTHSNGALDSSPFFKVARLAFSYFQRALVFRFVRFPPPPVRL